MCNRLGNGTRLGGGETPKSERGNAMDDYLVTVMEIRKWTENKRGCLSLTPRYGLRVKNRVQN